jgi:glycosyltransferase involved in cell wall biosynthesis
MKQRLSSLGCPPQKIAVTRCGPATEFFDLRPDFNSNTIVAVGRLTDKKAPHLTILAFAEALQRMPSLRLRIIGSGELASVCRDMIIALGLAQAVELVGSASKDEIMSAMQDAFLFVQHSVIALNGDTEGTPVAVLEAGAAGLPVVATRHAGIEEVIHHGVTGLLVNERDVMAMSDAILQFARNRELARSVGETARHHVKQNFSLQAHIDQLTNVILDAAS